MHSVEIAPGHDVPRLVVGLWQLSEGHRRRPRDRAGLLDLLGRLVGEGFTAFDCADIYTGVEELLGEFQAKRGRRSSDRPIRIHTKFVPDRERLASIDRRYVERIVDRSLARLAVERLDLVQFAWWDFGVPGYVETANWLDELRQAGKIRHLGVTNFDTLRLGEIVSAGVPIATQQVQYSVLDRRPDNGMVQFCRDQGIRLLCYGTLAGGFLSDRYLRSAPPTPPFANRSLTKYRLMIDEAGGWGRFQDLLSVLDGIASRHDATIAQVALSWVLGRPGVGCLLVGVADLDRMRDAAEALQLALSAEDRGLLDSWAREGPLPPGDVFEFERRSGGPHAAVMRYDLNEP